MTSKPWRRKRKGKPFGSYYASVDGATVNLQTQDVAEALKRIRLAKAGKWSPERVSDDDAPEIAEAEEAAQAAAAVDEALARPAEDATAHSPIAPEPAPAPAPPPVAPPSPEPEPEPAPAHASSVAEDVAAAAAEVRAEEGAGAASAETETTTTDIGLDPAEFVAAAGPGLVLGLQKLASVINERRDPPRKPIEVPRDHMLWKFRAQMENVTAESVKLLLLRWTGASGQIHPLVGVLVGSAAILGLGLALTEPTEPPPAQAASAAKEASGAPVVRPFVREARMPAGV